MIPTNRLGRWMDLAVGSILEATDVERELIVVFDGIDPATPPVWATHPDVVILQHEASLGPAAAMATAMAAARGDLIARLDSDDVNRPDRLVRQTRYLAEHPEIVAVSSRTMRIDEEGNEFGLVRLPSGADIRRHLLVSNVVPHSTLMFRRADGLRAGGYDIRLRQMEDYDFILRLAALGPIAQLEDPLVDYRIHSGQTSRGAVARGPHIAAVLRARRALAHVLGQARPLTVGRDAVWLLAQHLRSAGFIRPGHER